MLAPAVIAAVYLVRCSIRRRTEQRVRAGTRLSPLIDANEIRAVFVSLRGSELSRRESGCCSLFDSMSSDTLMAERGYSGSFLSLEKSGSSYNNSLDSYTFV